MMTRRHFVGTLGGLAAATGLGLTVIGPVRRRLAPAQLDEVALTPLAGSRVTLVGPDGTRLAASVSDVQCQSRPGRHGAPTTEQISLLVRPDRTGAPSGSYRLDAADLELDALTFTAVGPAGRDQQLEAVLTRIV